MISLGFMVSFKLLEMLCMVTDLPGPDAELLPLMTPPDELTHVPEYTDTGKASFRAIAAKHISMQIRKFW